MLTPLCGATLKAEQRLKKTYPLHEEAKNKHAMPVITCDCNMKHLLFCMPAQTIGRGDTDIEGRGQPDNNNSLRLFVADETPYSQHCFPASVGTG